MLNCSLRLGCASIAWLGGAGSTSAQTDQGVETVVVTGSRLPQQNLYSERPVTMVGPQEIKFEGTTDLATLLNNLPEAFADQTSTLSNGSSGIAAVDLRGLGAKRTLVAIDGSRLMPGDPLDPVADLDDIPASLVDHIEVLTGGASTVYGSDALAGVVNFIVRKDFEGIELDGTASIEQAPNDNSAQRNRLAAAGYPQMPENAWDGEAEDTTLLLGTNTGNGKGNVTAYLGYRSDQPVQERDFSACVLATNFVRFNPDDPLHTGLTCGGSGNYNHWFSLDDLLRNQPFNFFQTGNGTPGSGRFESWTGSPDQEYNFGPLNYLRRPDTRYVGGFFAHYTFDRLLEPYASFMFSDDHTLAQVAPSALFAGIGEVDGTFVEINCANPLMTGQERVLLCGADGSGSTNAIPGEATLLIGRRTLETGDRVEDFRHDAYRMQVGLKGDLGSGWSYDVYGQYGLTLYTQNLRNDLSIDRVQRALQTDPVTGACYAAEPNAAGVVTDPGCVPLDIFNGIGSITPAMANYIRADGLQEGSTDEQILSGSVTGDFGRWGGRSPLAQSPVRASFGTEWRSEFLGLDTDREFSTGDLYGAGGAVPGVPLSGFDSTEVFSEINVPLIEERPYAQDLAINAGYRYASYNTAGPVTSYKYGVEWQPFAEMRLRGMYERAVRAPNVLELFTPVEIGGFAATDPCSLSTAGQCAGVPNAGTRLLVCPSNTSNTTCNDETGGNLLLNPEKGRTSTIGLVLSPRFLDGFSATVDYFNIRVDDFIGTIDPLITLDLCYGPDATRSSEAYFCPLVHRNAEGELFGGGYVSAQNTNTGFLSTTGLDVQLDYSLNFEDWDVHGAGSVSLDLIGTVLESLITEPVPGQGSYDCAALYGAICGGPAPRWRHRLRVTWTTPWDDLAVSFAWRHMGSVGLDGNLDNPFFDSACGGAPCNDVPDARISSFDYLDVALDWPVRNNFDLRAGVNNIFAK
ncbi:MAG TPA: TonB-dependent receptor, partial [Rhizomicrobium sp.]|nr:TonB-dependent receptor [Rhizomicrobium sp.]